MRVVILAPARSDGGWRDKLWEFCRKIWEENFPEWEIFEGFHLAEEGPFNRSMAINRAAKAAGDWDAALIIDRDTISDPDAIRRAVDHAYRTGAMAVAHNQRYMMNKRGTEYILSGRKDRWKSPQFIKVIYKDSVSCAVAVSRATWDLVGGFDERFVGWGYEDSCYRIAVETLTDLTMHVEQADVYHLWHEISPEADKNSPTFQRNHALKSRYEYCYWQPERLHALLRGESDPGPKFGSIPRIMHRTVPEHTPDEVEQFWNHLIVLHPNWDMRTYREPIDPADWPLTGDLFDKCQNGAQKAGLIRLEALVTHGGVYVDSDVEGVRPMDPLLHLPAFAGWEDAKVVPDAILGCVPNHKAFREMLRLARESVERGEDAWKSGPGVSTNVLPWRDDVLLLPPGSLYPVHYLEKAALGSRNNDPWVFCEHKWNFSWGSDAQKASHARNQRLAGSPQERMRRQNPPRDRSRSR